MKLFLDENLSPQHASELRTEGHDAAAVVGVGLSGMTDEQVLRFAVRFLQEGGSQRHEGPADHAAFSRVSW